MIPLEVLGVQADPSRGTPVVLLQEVAEPRRVLPIFVGATEAASIAIGLTGTELPRPLTHDLLVDVLDRTASRLERIEVTEVHEGVFHAELAVTGPDGTHRVSSRPSDAIALAVRLDVPMFAAEDVLDEAGAVLVLDEDGGTEIDEADLEQELTSFREFLATVDPVDFGGTSDPGDPGTP